MTKEQSNTLAQLSAIQAVADKVKPLTDMKSMFSINANINGSETAFGFLVNLFEVIGSYDDMVEWLSNFIVNAIPALEIAVKGVLLANLKGMGACNTDPRIPQQYRKNPTPNSGFYINISSIDYADMLRVSPLTNDGASYYFGTFKEEVVGETEKDWQHYTPKEKIIYAKSKGKQKPESKMKVKKKIFISPYKLARAYDFNAFLWFVIHKGRFPSPKILDRYTHTGITEAISTAFSGEAESKFLEYDKESKDYKPRTVDQGIPLASYVNVDTHTPVIVGASLVENYGNGKVSHTVLMAHEVGQTEMEIQQGQPPEDVTDWDEYYNLPLPTITRYHAFYAPVSDDTKSVNWYADPSNYYAYNLSLPKAERPNIDYNRSKPVCNISYLGGGYGNNRTLTSRFKVSIPIKPFSIFVPGDGSSPLPTIKNILFNELGQPDPQGHFSFDAATIQPTPPSSDARMIGYLLSWFQNNYTIPTMSSTSDKLDFILFSRRIFGENLSNLDYAEKMCKSGSVTYKLSDETQIEQIEDANSIYCACLQTGKTNITPSCRTLGDINAMKSFTKEFDNKLSTAIETDTEIQNVTNTYDIGNSGLKIQINALNGQFKILNADLSEASVSDYAYLLQECYPGLTVYEFNYDMVMGMKLFDARLIATSLVNALYNLRLGFDVSLPSLFSTTLSYKIRQYITDILNTEDETEITDCFYTFSNLSYNAMLQKTEQEYLKRGSVKSAKRVDLDPLLEILDEYDENGTLHEQKDVINRFFKQASVTMSDVDAGDTDKMHIQTKFAHNLMGLLAQIFVEVLLTPKIVMLYMINSKVMGSDILSEGVSFEDFLKAIKNLLVAVIKEIRDLIMRELLNFLLKLLKPILALFSAEALKEQFIVYKELIERLLRDCIGLGGSGGGLIGLMKSLSSLVGRWTELDVTLPEVNYADIESGTTIPVINNC